MSDGIGIEILRKTRQPPASLIERILSVITPLGLVCLGIGLILFIYGRASNNLIVAQIGAYALVIGGLLVALRLLWWIAVEMVERA